MYIVNENSELTESQRKLIEGQLNSKAGRGFAKHSSQQKSVRIMEAKGFCKARYAIERGLLWDLTVTIKVTESLPYATRVDVLPKRSEQEALDIPADIMAEGSAHAEKEPILTKAQSCLIQEARENGGYVEVFGNRIRTARRLADMGYGLQSSTVVTSGGHRRLAGAGRCVGAFYITAEYAAKIGYGKYKG